MSNPELDQTLVLIKPDALKNSLTGYVLSQLAEFHTGLRFAGTKVVHVPRMLAEEHYAEHRSKLFFPALLEYIMGQDHYPNKPDKQRVIAIVYQGPDAVARVRDIVGPTNPHIAREQRPGSIRSLGTVVPIRNEAGEEISFRLDNLIHASAVPEEAEREIKLWFKPVEIPPYMRVYATSRCTDLVFYIDGRITSEYEEGSVCLFAPGDVAWSTDLDVISAAREGRPLPYSLEAVAAKYVANVDAVE